MLPPPAHVVVIHDDGGGLVDAFARRVARYGRRVRRIEIRGECASACTMVLALSDRICVGPHAVFGFHQAFNRYARRPDDTSDRSEPGTAVLMAHYPPAVVTWIERHGGLGPDLIWLSGPELEAIVPACQRASDAEGGDRTINAIPVHQNSSANVSKMLTYMRSGWHGGSRHKDSFSRTAGNTSGQNGAGKGGDR